jgi:hypothetical protein
MLDVRSTTTAGSSKIGNEEGRRNDDQDPCHVDHDRKAVSEESREEGVGSMFDQLALDEEDFDDFAIEDDDAALAEGARWMVVSQIFINKKNLVIKPYCSKCRTRGTWYARSQFVP